MYNSYLRASQELELELHTTQYSFQGKLFISDGSWQFYSSHPAFAQLFPSSMLTNLSDHSAHADGAEMHQTISQIVSSLWRYE